jgi:hypothetical protein
MQGVLSAVTMLLIRRELRGSSSSCRCMASFVASIRRSPPAPFPPHLPLLITHAHTPVYQVTRITPANASTLWPGYEATFGIPRGIPRGDVLSYYVVTQGPHPEVIYAHLHTSTIKHARYLPRSLWCVSLSSSTNGLPLWYDATGIGSFF